MNLIKDKKVLDLSGGPGVVSIALNLLNINVEYCDIGKTIDMALINFNLNNVIIKHFE